MDILSNKYGEQIRVLSSTLWENKVQGPRITEWLQNFSTEEEKEYAIYLLSRLMYFGSISMRNLIKSLYRDLYRYPLIKQIRKDDGDTMDESIIESKFNEELHKTRFLGVGNPSESGVHLLYYFRQENRIPKDLFINTDDVVIYDSGKPKIKKEFEDIKNFVFIDDVCGSGTQATSNDSNVKRCVQHLKSLIPSAKVSYIMLFGVSDGIKVVKESNLYDYVDSVIELNNSYKCFGPDSRFFKDGIHDKEKAKSIAFKYGYKVMYDLYKNIYKFPDIYCDKFARNSALGFGDCQLLLSMHHNTPDNTLPIIWYDENNTLWKPIFKRYNKIYE